MNKIDSKKIVNVLKNNAPTIVIGAFYLVTYVATRQYLNSKTNPAALVIMPADIERLKLGKQFLDFTDPSGDIIRVDYIPAK